MANNSYTGQEFNNSEFRASIIERDRRVIGATHRLYYSRVSAQNTAAAATRLVAYQTQPAATVGNPNVSTQTNVASEKSVQFTPVQPEANVVPIAQPVNTSATAGEEARQKQMEDNALAAIEAIHTQNNTGGYANA